MARKPPASFVEVVCSHGKAPRSLGHFHPSTVEVMDPSCQTTDGRMKPHPGPLRR